MMWPVGTVAPVAAVATVSAMLGMGQVWRRLAVGAWRLRLWRWREVLVRWVLQVGRRVVVVVVVVRRRVLGDVAELGVVVQWRVALWPSSVVQVGRVGRVRDEGGM